MDAIEKQTLVCPHPPHPTTHPSPTCSLPFMFPHLPPPPCPQVMIGAVEKQKLVYILNRDAAARLTISSPLEVGASFLQAPP